MMSRMDALLQDFEGFAGGAGKWRLGKELKYARRVSFVNGGRHDALIERALAEAAARMRSDGALTDAAAAEIEKSLMPMAGDCKRYRLLFVGHAHIDMNWMWRYDETVSITLDTFRTALNLMKAFPDFTFAQSQASTYAIVEQHEPEMIDEIRAAIARGQWEVSASTWVEADRNLPNAESVARHFLYTKRYLPKLLGVQPESLNFDFEPDTFGHHQNVPEMLCQAGAKYYYHCRGEQDHTLYRWESPSGKRILCYREPWWYLGPVSGDEAERLPQFCDQFGIDTGLSVYGVGDHGGGPTRRDLERITDMASWPIYPRVAFGSYAQFYAEAEKAQNVPVLTGERNVVFSGCYTTQTRIKRGNRMAERMLFDAEGLNAFAALNLGAPYRRAAFERAWRHVLFNQFHDIIPGSGVIDTREHAMGLYQQAFAAAASALRASANAIADGIDTSGFAPADPSGTTSEGAGQGFGVYDFKLGQVSRGGGKHRVFHVFNALPYPRKEVAEFVLWDYREPLDRIEFVDSSCNPTRHQVISSEFKEYWQHDWAKVLVEVDVPAMGYASYALRLKDEAEMATAVRTDPRIEEPLKMVLENELIRAEFDAQDARLCSITDKQSGAARVCGAGFALVNEDPSAGMTAWVVGRHAGTRRPCADRIRRIHDGPLYKAYRVEARLSETSKIEYTVSLRAGERKIEYDVKCDWHEIGTEDAGIPQLRFAACAESAFAKSVSDIPGGLIERDPKPQDVPTQGMIAAGGAVLLADSKYGFRCDGSELGVTLIRSSFDPDPYPELGEHKFRLATGASEAKGAALLAEAARWNHPLHVISGNHHAGSAPLDGSFLRLEGGAMLSAVKLCEDEDALLVRLIDIDGTGKARLAFDRPVASAARVDTLERPVDLPAKLTGKKVDVTLEPYGMCAVKIAFQ